MSTIRKEALTHLTNEELREIRCKLDGYLKGKGVTLPPFIKNLVFVDPEKIVKRVCRIITLLDVIIVERFIDKTIN